MLKYTPFTSSVELNFWKQFTKLKLEKYKLSTDPVEITGSYVNNQEAELMPRFSVGYNAFIPLDSNCGNGTNNEFQCRGVLLHTNTKEEYQKCDRKSLLASQASDCLWQHLVSGTAIQEPALLNTFIIHLFADLKKYHYTYWFAFPAYIGLWETLVTPVQTLADVWTQEQMSDLLSSYDSRTMTSPFFVVEQCDDGSFVCHALTQYHVLRQHNKKALLCLADPSTVAGVPGWPLRNLLLLALLHWKYPSHHVLCLRMRSSPSGRSVSSSLFLEVALEDKSEGQVLTASNLQSPPTAVGWERNSKGQLAPIMANLSKTNDPIKQNDNACEMTLQLMRWRAVPELDVAKMAATRCLLLGAGTLGCNVARALLGWGIRHITFVDGGRVSQSNPVRQSLYTFADTEAAGNGPKYKASTAAEAIKAIRPGLECRGEVLHIPMPGHTPGKTQLEAVLKDVDRLKQLVEDHDVLFLLTDSRESRWLPTVMGAVQKKIVITAALGFDSFLVVRHGSKNNPDTARPVNCFSNIIGGSQLGCYFCNDIVVPNNSTADRTLDQQCTVSRPGVSMMAAAEAVELMASLIQHPDGNDAPSGPDSKEGVLGSVPHSVRYFMTNRQLITPTTPAFVQCSACGQQILERYVRDGSAMLLKVFESADNLEEMSGISNLHDPIKNSAGEEIKLYITAEDEDDF